MNPEIDKDGTKRWLDSDGKYHREDLGRSMITNLKELNKVVNKNDFIIGKIKDVRLSIENSLTLLENEYSDDTVGNLALVQQLQQTLLGLSSHLISWDQRKTKKASYYGLLRVSLVKKHNKELVIVTLKDSHPAIAHGSRLMVGSIVDREFYNLGTYWNLLSKEEQVLVESITNYWK